MNMNMNEYKGKRLIAAVAVLALIACAFVAFVPSDGVDGAPAETDVTANNATILTVTEGKTNIASSASAVSYFLNATSAVEVTVTGTETGAISLYVYGSGAVTIKTPATASIPVTVYIASEAITTAATVTYYKNVSVTATSTATAGSVVVTPSPSTTNPSILVGTPANVTVNSTNYGISTIASTGTTYYAKGVEQAVSLSSTGITSVNIVEGVATVSQGTNTAKITVAAGQSDVTVTYQSTYPLIAAEDGTLPTVEIQSGIFTGAAYCNLIGVQLNGNSFMASQVMSSVGDTKITTAKVYGNVIQKTQVGSASAAARDLVTLSFANANASLTINEGVNVYVGSIDNTNVGSFTIFGAIYNKSTSVEAAGITIGANGYYNGITASEYSNTNVTSASAEDFEIAGEPSSDSVGDAIIKTGSTLTIPEGTTFTITGNFGLNGQELVVNGTLVINNKASIYGTGNGTEKITIGEKGSIQNNGTIGKMIGVKIGYTTQSITVQGVSGVSFSIDKTAGMVVTGNITATSGAPVSKLTINGAVIGGDFTTAKKVDLALDTDVDVSKNAVVVLNGNVSGNHAIKVSEGASISVNGALAGSVTAAVGLLKDNTTFETGKEGVVTIGTISNVTGFTMYVKKVGVANETTDKTDYYLRAYVNGSLSLIDKTQTSGSNTIAITGDDEFNVYIASGETLNVNDYVKADIDNVVFEGSAVFTNNSGYTGGDVTNYIGATYIVETAGENNSTIETTYFTSLAAAMDKIADANDEGVTAYVDDLNINVTVADGQILNLNIAGTISQDAVLTVQNGATLGGNIAKVDGKMVIQPDVVSSVTPQVYDVRSTAADGTVTYAGIAVAIAEAQPGDKITVEQATIGTAGSTTKQSLTIPQGVEVTVNQNLVINGDLTIAAEAKLVGGAINMTYDGAKVTVNGTLDLSAGSITGDNFSLTSAGTTIVTSTDGLNYSGATYNDNGIVITSVANALAYATENDEPAINIHGTVSEPGALTVDGVNIVLDEGAKVTLGNVTLSDAKITSTGAELTATISGMNGEGDAAANGTVSLSKSAVTITAQESVDAAGTTVYVFSIGGIDGTMVVQSGTVVINGPVITDAGSKFTVASGATLLVAKNGVLTVSGKDTTFTVDGTMTVDEGQVEFDNTAAATINAVINGTVDISGSGIVKADKLVINGTVNVSAVENDEGTFQVTDNGVQVGTASESLGVGGAIVGPVTVDDTKYVLAFAGADVSGAQFNQNSGETTIETTAYYINSVLYATAYAEGSVGYATPVTLEMVKDISGIAVPSTATNVDWKDAEGKELPATVTYVGDAEAVYTEYDLATVTIKVSVGTGISLYIDNVKVEGPNYLLTVGTHTVSATVNPGYAGEVTIFFDGQTVTGGSIEITVDSAGVVLAALGDISVDTGSSGSSSDGMSLTEILLVILVILIVVMAIMVALRLMRS